MTTLRAFIEHPPASLPTITAFLLSDLAEGRGKQELFAHQYPRRLARLRENALVESAVSSNRIEGVEIERARLAPVIEGKQPLRDRNEEEVAGYRRALDLIHEQKAKLPPTEQAVLQFHRLCRGDIWDAGKYKERNIDIIETYPDGRSRIRFRPVSAEETPGAMGELFRFYELGLRESPVPPPILVAALNLDFLCIHPFRDGNGRVSRLMLLQGLYQCGFEVGRYISIERLVEQNKQRYYETLEESSQGWHEGQHHPWPYINFILYIFNQAMKEFQDRLGDVSAPKGEKSRIVRSAIHRQARAFTVADLQVACPGVSIDTIRLVLKNLRGTDVECLGRGRNAQWRRLN